MALLNLARKPEPPDTRPAALRGRDSGSIPSRVSGTVKIVDGSILSGICHWPFDPFFRPTIGLFIDRKPRRVIQTVRVPIAGRTGEVDWRCRFEIEDQVAVDAIEGVELVCLETGTVIHDGASRRPAAASRRLDIPDLVALSARRRAPFDASGFTAFLHLSASDQISLIYHAVLARAPDAYGLEQYIDELESGGLTILGVRDRLLRSEEFLESRLRTVESMLGQWIVWGGLGDVGPALLSSTPAMLGDRSIEFETWKKSGGVAPYLARVALGEGADGDLLSSWTKDNAASIADFAAASHRASAGETRQPTSPNSLDLGNLLESMRVGVAGHRLKSKIELRPGQPGAVVFGPYARLEHGRYRLGAYLHASPAADSTDPRLTLEVVFGDMLIAAKCIPEKEFGLARHVLEFDVPTGFRALTAPLFEFRLHSDGQVKGELVALNLERTGNASQDRGFSPNVENWLAILTPGAAGQRAGAGIRGKAGVTGHVFHGPYRGLFPGRYLLELRVGDPFESRDAAAQLVIEIVGASGTTLGIRDITLSGSCAKGELLFEIRQPPDPRALPEPLEIRLHKRTPSPIEITGLTISSLTGPGR